jgi:uncharacterized protein (DUF2126 family)
MKVERVWEAPRVTKPYSDEQWAAIEALGHRIDADLTRARRAPDAWAASRPSCRSTTATAPNGTPTRSGRPSANRASAPWPKLLFRLRTTMRRKGLLHFGQGKWYPGEQLPRWSLNCFWRRDGEPIWHDPALFARRAPGTAPTTAWRRASSRASASACAGAGQRSGCLARLRGRLVLPVARAPAAGQRRSARCARRRSAGARAAAPRCSSQGLTRSSGMCCRSRATRRPAGALAERAVVPARERCYLIPGDSPIGYRLPLDSQPWVAQGRLSLDPPRRSEPALSRRCRARRAAPAVAADRDDLGADSGLGFAAHGGGWTPSRVEHAGFHADRARPRSRGGCRRSPARRAQDPAAAGALRVGGLDHPHRAVRRAARRPAVSVHAAAGALEDYLELVTAIEATAAEFALPVVLEGYEPPPTRASRTSASRPTRA